MDEESEDSDEIVELDLITSCTTTKVVPVQVPQDTPLLKEESREPPIGMFACVSFHNSSI